MPSGISNDPHAFAMGFISNSKHWRSQYIDKWREVIANFIVEPYHGGNNAKTTSNPYSNQYGNRRNNITLKGGETHKVVMTYASKLVLAALGDTRGEYVQAEPSGYEDARKAQTTTKLLRHGFTRPGFFRSAVETVVDELLIGTAVAEIPWTLIEREMLIRSIATDESGFEESTFQRQRVAAFDDPELIPLDVQDFYPDPSEHILEKMSGVAKRFRVNRMEARTRTGGKFGYRVEAVSRAFSGAKSDNEPRSAVEENFRENLDQPTDKNAHPDFNEQIGFEYWGEVPWEDDQGSSRRVITVINNVLVRDIPYPLADEDLPFRAATINPVQGRFYGVSPAEVIRYDQDLQDAVNILLAIAIKRQVLPPIAYDPMGDIDEAKLKAWDDDTLIPIQGGPNMIGTVKYESGVFQGMQLVQNRKVEMQETSGATAGVQGQELSTKRMSATEAQNTITQALDRPELASALLEREFLPSVAKSFIRRYQQFLDTEGLQRRVGEMPEPVWIGDIQGDFDIRFIGSRMAMSRQQRLQAMDRLITYASVNPVFAAMLPNLQLAQELIGDTLELPEIAAMVGDPQQFQLNILMQQLLGAGGAGNGNGTAVSAEPAGALPAQVSGAAGG